MKGQITIFLALVFFVLFTLFGMTISMGMFVHDKINLQNATDLASYYVATKQAEMLTAIAHSNYQIRQSWKLAAFRYRVLSNGSRTEGVHFHPGVSNDPTSAQNDHATKYSPASLTTAGGVPVPPRVCVGATHLFKELSGDNLCKRISFSVSYVPNVPSYASIGVIGTTNTTIDNTNVSIVNSCRSTTYINWWFANTILGAHKLEQRDRRAVIEALAKNLALRITPGGMKDLDGGDVYEGAQKTFLYNLSEANRENREAATLSIKNSMEGLSPSDWLSPIFINTILPFSYFTSTIDNQCSEEVKTHVNSAEVTNMLSDSASAATRSLSQQLDPDTQIEYYGSIEENTADRFMNITLGVEKNPWFMVYNRVESRAVSKPLFLSNVFGEGVTMKSVAYSKPFGGRIGPWYRSQWLSGSPESNGGDRTDGRLPPRVEEGQLGDAPVDDFDPTLWPNISRYPGDEDGLTTRASMVAYGRLVGNWFVSGSPIAANLQTSLYDYQQSTYSYFNVNYNDPLAQNTTPGRDPWDSFNRRLEIAAIAPDIFDMTYYTIVPGFYDYFVKDRLGDWLVVPENVEVRGDIGAYDRPENGIINFDILDQIDISSVTEIKDGVFRKREAPWLHNPNKRGYLSSWIPGIEVMNYEAADQGDVKDRFAHCIENLPQGRAKIPSECLSGGRSGYSVKMISKKYLEANHPIGGEGITGSISNIY